VGVLTAFPEAHVGFIEYVDEQKARAHRRFAIRNTRVCPRESGPTTNEVDPTQRKRPERATIAPEARLLVGRTEAAEMLSISCRALDYLVASKQLNVCRIGAGVLIAVSDLKRF
jgi:hypothetical protein